MRELHCGLGHLIKRFLCLYFGVGSSDWLGVGGASEKAMSLMGTNQDLALFELHLTTVGGSFAGVTRCLTLNK